MLSVSSDNVNLFCSVVIILILVSHEEGDADNTAIMYTEESGK